MKTVVIAIGAMLVAELAIAANAVAPKAFAQGTSKTQAATAPPASLPGHQSRRAASPAGTSGSQSPSRTIAPGFYSNRSANAGNASESNGILGSHGARGDTNA